LNLTQGLSKRGRFSKVSKRKDIIMHCAAIIELLSEYIDGTLDSKPKEAVEKHILTCKNCKQELSSLSAIAEELGSLDHIKPPADFLEKIHERMEPRFGFNKIVRKLFVPFRIKIPLELAAAATVAILVVLVLNIQQPEIQMMKIPTASKSQRLAEKPKEDRIKSTFKKENESPEPAFEEAPAKLSDSEHVMLALRSKSKAVKPSIQRESEPFSSFMTKAESKQAAGKGQPIELALVLKTGVIGGAYKPGIAMQTAPLLESDESTAEKKRGDIDSFGRKIEARQKGQPANLLSRMKHIIDLAQGKVLTVKYDRQTEQLKSIYAKIPAKNYESFCRELARMATFQNPPPDLADKDLKTIQVHIRFISL
jgi:hypothetical protein